MNDVKWIILTAITGYVNLNLMHLESECSYILKATSYSARSVLRSGWTEFSGCTTSLAKALAAHPWVTWRRASWNTRTTAEASERVSALESCSRTSDYPCRRKRRLKPLPSSTGSRECERTFPTTRGLAVHRARWCRARDSAPPPDRANSLKKPSN